MKIEVNNFSLKDILLSGACFRAYENEDGSFTNILKDRVINIKQDGNILTINASKNDNLKEIIYDYFDLNRDYDSINKYLSSRDKIMKDIVNKCLDYRILNQDSFEMGISYIISQSNNVKRISKIIDNLCTKYGDKVYFEGQEYHLFPSYEQLKDLKVEDFTKLKVGFRDKYLFDYIQKYSELDIDNLSTNDALKKLMSIKGIGLKVASCILLFGYRRLDTFPIDTWVKKSISENYNIKNDQKTIERFAKEKYGEYTGLAIQYLFHSQRNK